MQSDVKNERITFLRTECNLFVKNSHAIERSNANGVDAKSGNKNVREGRLLIIQ